MNKRNSVILFFFHSQGLDEDNDIYSDEEMAEYERHLKQEENRLHEQNAYEHVVPGQVVSTVFLFGFTFLKVFYNIILLFEQK